MDTETNETLEEPTPPPPPPPLTSQAILATLVSVIGARWSTWDRARSEARAVARTS